MNVQKDSVFLIRILFKTLDAKLLNESVGTLYPIQKLDNLRAQISFGFAAPVFKRTTVKKIEQYLGNVVKHTHHRVGLQAQVVAIEQSLGRKSHNLSVFINHRNQPHFLQLRNLTFLQLENNDVHFVNTRSEERRVGKECRSRWSPNP